MFLLKISSSFAAAHRISGYPGKCGEIHGHNYGVIVILKAEGLGELDMAFDFAEAKRILNQVLEPLDHKLLNDLLPFKSVNPTAEKLAEYIYKVLEGKIPDGISVYQVEVAETPTNSVIYRR